MRVVLELEGTATGTDVDVAELYSWLTRTREVRRVGEVSLEAGRQGGAMSAGDVIVLTATAASSLSAVVQAFVAWRSARQSAPALVLRFEEGTVVRVEHGSAKDIALIVGTAELACARLQGAVSQASGSAAPEASAAFTAPTVSAAPREPDSGPSVRQGPYSPRHGSARS